MNARRGYRLALMWRGDPKAPDRLASHATRVRPLMAALKDEGIEAEQVVYFDEDVAAARARLLACDGAIVWINPLADGRDRSQVDALLREVSAAGRWVSTHPDTIKAMGTKEVLWRTRQITWGSDTDIYDTHDAFGLRFPVKLSVAGTRVLKPMRGNDGQGVLKVELAGKGEVSVQAAADDVVRVLPLAGFIAEMAGAFDGGASLIDQAFQPRVSDGMVRCYMSRGDVVGFAEQFPRVREPGVPALGMNSAKTMHGRDAPAFKDLCERMEREWTPGLQRALDLATSALPILWDADFFYRPEPLLGNEPRFVLCEINVSSVSPFPDVAAPLIAANVRRALDER